MALCWSTEDLLEEEVQDAKVKAATTRAKPIR